jgi:hypothetical protein
MKAGLTPPQLAALETLFRAGIWRRSVTIREIGMGRHSIIVARGLLTLGILRTISTDYRHLPDSFPLELTEAGLKLCDTLGMQIHDATPSIEYRKKKLLDCLERMDPWYTAELEGLIEGALHWGRKHAAELLEANASHLKTQSNGNDADLKLGWVLRDQARQIRAMRTTRRDGEYVSERGL